MNKAKKDKPIRISVDCERELFMLAKIELLRRGQSVSDAVRGCLREFAAITRDMDSRAVESVVRSSRRKDN